MVTNATVSPSQWPLVSVVVVNYNGGVRLARCLESLLHGTYPAQEFIIVDNASTDNSPEIIKDFAKTHSSLITLWSASNLGYAGAVNLALASARGDYLAVMNMDVTVERDWLEPLIAFLKEHRGTGAVNPLILLADGERVNAEGLDIHVTGLGFTRGLGRPLDKSPRSPVQTSGLSGAVFVISTDLLRRIGGLDTTGFLYHEDVNLSWLLHLIGLDLYCVRQSLVRHDYLLTMYPAKIHLLERNRWAMLFAYLRPASLFMLLPVLLLTEILMWSFCILRGPSFIKAKWASYRWVYEQWQEIQERRRLVESMRVVSDWDVLKKLCWAYAWNQLVTVGKERGPSARNTIEGIRQG
jgi:GT2 family glycosyltransferase